LKSVVILTDSELRHAPFGCSIRTPGWRNASASASGSYPHGGATGSCSRWDTPTGATGGTRTAPSNGSFIPWTDTTPPPATPPFGQMSGLNLGGRWTSGPVWRRPKSNRRLLFLHGVDRQRLMNSPGCGPRRTPPVNLAERRRLTLAEWWRSVEHAEECRRYVARLAVDLENAASIPSARSLEVVVSAVDALVATQDAMNHAGQEARRRVGWRVGRGIRSAGLSLLGRFIPDAGLVRIRDFLARVGSAFGHSNERFLGGSRSAARRCPAALLEANPDMASVLADVETVGTFHRARAIRGARR
jgi:hypothetical protein